MSLTADRLPRRNLRLAAGLVAFVALMVGLAYAAVPLYAIFCQVTGYGGTTQRAEANLSGVIDRDMTVRFDANIDSALPWRIEPASLATGKIGSVETVAYRVTNLSDRTVTGTAAFNVTPEIAGVYFNKIECFCFTEQTLAPGETVEMGITYFVDPALDEDTDLDSLHEITLSYTFYPAGNQGG
jgi:cytochrome c oxidase assembly protein subunit 11